MPHVSPPAYSRTTGPELHPRDVEYQVLAQSTQKLARAAQHGQDRTQELFAALDANEQIWSTLAIDVAGTENRLPKELRAKLYFLYEFVAKHSQSIRMGEANSVGVLIDINSAVMRGLRGQLPGMEVAA